MKEDWWKKLTKYLIQEVPTNLAYCEFDCHSINCEDCPLIEKMLVSKCDL